MVLLFFDVNTGGGGSGIPLLLLDVSSAVLEEDASADADDADDDDDTDENEEAEVANAEQTRYDCGRRSMTPCNTKKNRRLTNVVTVRTRKEEEEDCRWLWFIVKCAILARDRLSKERK
jgi:hypothetical protein